jgi:hypothetical protein
VARAGLKDDAYAHVIEAQSAVLGELVEFVAEVRQARQPPAVFTDEQVGDIGRRLMGACQAWAGGMVRAANLRSWVLMLATVLGAAVIGGLGVWLAFGKPLDPVCVDIQGGGRICGEWTIPPGRKP